MSFPCTSICSVHSGAFVAYSGVTVVSFSSLRCHSSLFRYIPVPFLSIPFHSAGIPARSGTFRYHSCPFRFIPASFCLVPVYSGLFPYIPFRSIPFLCLATPDNYSKSNLRHANYYQFKIRHARTNILKLSGIMKPFCHYISKNLNLEKNLKITIIRILSTPKMI